MKTNDTDISGGSQRELAAGVLKQAAWDLRRFHNANTKIEREIYLDAYSWVMSDDCNWPFSFLNVCRLLHRVPEELREELIGELSLGTFSRWVRCWQRTARRFSNSISQRFATDRNESAATPVSLMQTSY